MPNRRSAPIGRINPISGLSTEQYPEVRCYFEGLRPSLKDDAPLGLGPERAPSFSEREVRRKRRIVNELERAARNAEMHPTPEGAFQIVAACSVSESGVARF